MAKQVECLAGVVENRRDGEIGAPRVFNVGAAELAPQRLIEGNMIEQRVARNVRRLKPRLVTNTSCVRRSTSSGLSSNAKPPASQRRRSFRPEYRTSRRVP